MLRGLRLGCSTFCFAVALQTVSVTCSASIVDWSSYEDYDRQLSTYAIFGLALSGHPRAGDALKSLPRSPAPEQAWFRQGLDDVLTTWLEVYELVADKGIAGMYEYERTRQ